jgi:hypothetical protein
MLNDMMLYYFQGVAYGFILSLVAWAFFYAVASLKHVITSL